jgi:uncharacterized protein (DUF934 family)
MRQIIRRHEIVADDAYYADEADPPEVQPEMQPGMRRVPALAQWLADIAAGKPCANAVLIGPEADARQVAAYLSQLTLVVIDFPKIGEGRGFSQARLLRQRYRYRGELRARGALKRDQIFFLARCGFDSFQLDPSEDPRAAVAALRTYSVAYQDGIDQLVQVERRPSSAP